MDNTQETNNQEIDLVYLAQKIKELFLSFCFLQCVQMTFLLPNLN